MSLKTIIEHVKTRYHQNSTDKKRRWALTEYLAFYPAVNEENLPDIFYIWYYLKHVLSFTSLSFDEFPIEKDGLFNGYEIQPLAITGEKGIKEPCEEEDADLWSLSVKRGKGGIITIILCSTKDIATYFKTRLIQQLRVIKSLPQNASGNSTFNAEELLKATALVAYEIKTKEIFP